MEKNQQRNVCNNFLIMTKTIELRKNNSLFWGGFKNKMKKKHSQKSQQRFIKILENYCKPY